MQLHGLQNLIRSDTFFALELSNLFAGLLSTRKQNTYESYGQDLQQNAFAYCSSGRGLPCNRTENPPLKVHKTF
jgi:hypothetical protein